VYEEGIWRLGVPNLKDLNLRLLENWIKRYIKDEGKI
jgi:hypothetical protein